MWPKSKIVQLLWFSQGKNKVSNVLYRSIHIVFVYFQRWEQNSWESVGRMSWMSFTLSSGTEKRNSQQLTEVVWVLKLILRQYSQQYYLFSYRYVIMIISFFFTEVSWTACCGQWSQWSTTCVVLCTVCQENERDGISHLCFTTLYPNLV